MPLGSLWMYASTMVPLLSVTGVWVMMSWFIGLVWLKVKRIARW